MDIFDIIGPVMVGPSSSHTAGVVRIGNVARRILGDTAGDIKVMFHGSLADTYKGHGSDRAVIAGMLGFAADDARIRNSLELAEEEGVSFSFQKVKLDDVHPNTLIIHAEKNGKTVDVVGHSIGGGNILISNINGIEVEFTGKYDTLVINHNDAPGVIASVTKMLADENINIANMKVYRAQKGGSAIMVIDTDDRLSRSLGAKARVIENVEGATVIEGIY